MGSHDTFEKTQLMAKRRFGSQIANLISNHKNSGIILIHLCVGGVPHIFGKLSMKATTLL